MLGLAVLLFAVGIGGCLFEGSKLLGILFGILLLGSIYVFGLLVFFTLLGKAENLLSNNPLSIAFLVLKTLDDFSSAL